MMELGDVEGERYVVGLKEVERQHVTRSCLCKHVIMLISHDLVIMRCVQVVSLIPSPSVGTWLKVSKVPTSSTVFLHIPAPSGIHGLVPFSPDLAHWCPTEDTHPPLPSSEGCGRLLADQQRNWGWRNMRGDPGSGRPAQCITKTGNDKSRCLFSPILSSSTRHSHPLHSHCQRHHLPCVQM